MYTRDRIDRDRILSDIDCCLRGHASEEQEKRVREWIAEDPANLYEYRRRSSVFYKLHYLVRWNLIDRDSAMENVKKQLKYRRNRTLLYTFSGIAAGLLLFFGVVLLLNNTDSSEQKLVVDELQIILPGEKKAVLTLADGKQIDLTSGNGVDIGFARVVEDSVAGLVYRFQDSVKVCSDYNTLTVPRGGEYIMTLSDGTRVWLNSDSELKYPVIFNGKSREVFVTGEAFFDVVTDAIHPFVVKTPYSKTVVKGTAFNVMAYKDEQFTEITLVRGVVEVGTGGRTKRIIPGQQVCVDNQTLKLTERDVNVAFYTSWKDGLFDFEGMTLEDLSVKLSRWYDVDFFFQNNMVREKKFTGAIKRNNTLSFMLDFIEKTSGVRCDVKGKTVTVYN